MGNSSFTSEHLLGVLGDLEQRWIERKGGLQSAKHRDGYTGAPRVAILGGLAEHVHHLARAVAHLHRSDLEFESYPLVRAAYESAVTAQWVGHNALAPSALAAEYARGRKNLVGTMRKSATSVFANSASTIVVDTPPPLGDTLKDRAKNFERLCGDFAPEGNDLYLLYRILSDASHASFAVVDHNVAIDPADGSLTIARQREHGMPPDFLLWMTATSVIWSDVAMNYLTRDRSWRKELLAFARTVHTVPELNLTARAAWDADRKLAEARKAERRSGEQGLSL